MDSRLRYILLLVVAIMATPLASYAQGRPGAARQQSQQQSGPKITQQSYAWTVDQPVGLRLPAIVDTMEYNYYLRSIPSQAFSYAWACTGNLGAEGKNMLAMQQKPISDFFLVDAQLQWLPLYSPQKFYNSRIPFTLVSYNTGGDRNNAQDRLNVVFSGNINRRAQVGANLDYLYSKGSYSNQATKGLSWGLNGSYLGERYQFQGYWNHYNLVNKENGGITDDLYITDPAKLQGGIATINPKSIPTNLQNAHTRVVGGELMLNNRYNVGYWRTDSIVNQGDTTEIEYKSYVPVSTFFWDVSYRQGRHVFHDDMAGETSRFFEHTYLNERLTDDRTKYWQMSHSVGVSMLEGFNKYAKFGMAAYLTYEMRRYTQTADTLDRVITEGSRLSPFPDGIEAIAPKGSQNLAWVGAQISKQQGSILTYEAVGEIGVIGDAAGEFRAKGSVTTHIPLFGDTVLISGYGSLSNTLAPYLLNNYVSNHFVWHNSFGKERRLRFGGILNIPWTDTHINVGTETLQNLLYFDDHALPQQSSSAIQVFSATLDQRLHLGILHFDNQITFQTSSNDQAMPLPKLALHSNLYLLCRIATLHLQLGIDCGYYTKYYAPAYQPATATFYNQREQKLGNYPFMTAYANMKLGRTRFYVMMTHVNQGWLGGNNYFSTPHYPLNPRRFQMGLSVDFWQ